MKIVGTLSNNQNAVNGVLSDESQEAVGTLSTNAQPLRGTLRSGNQVLRTTLSSNSQIISGGLSPELVSIGISSVDIDENYHLVVTYTNGDVWTSDESIQGPQGEQGPQGTGSYPTITASELGTGTSTADRVVTPKVIHDYVENEIPTNVSAFTNDSGYLTTETDPVYSSSVASYITQNDLDKWNNAVPAANYDGNATFRIKNGENSEDPTFIGVSKNGSAMGPAHIELGYSNNATYLTLTGLSTPTSDADAATKKYVDDAVSGGGGGVTGVKGNEESTYRTGNVNITSANVGALATSGGTLTGRVTTVKPFNQLLTGGSGTVGADNGTSASPHRYTPSLWKFNTDWSFTDGDIICIEAPVAGITYGVWLSIDNGTTYKPIVRQGTTRLQTQFGVNTQIMLMYDATGSASIYAVDGSDASSTVTGGVWRILNFYDSNDNTVPSAYCTTAADTAAKTATCTNYYLLSNSYLHIVIQYTNTKASALTLNVNSRGAKSIYINGTASSSTNYNLPRGSYIVYYDGSKYYFRTDGKLTANITGDAGTVNGHTVATDVPSGALFTDTVTTATTTGSGNAVTSISASNGALTVTKGSTFLTSYTETDPTVPSWAKESSKPSYTASEVGALATTGGTITGDTDFSGTGNVFDLKSAAATNSPILRFQRGELNDNYNDWQIQDRGGYLYFDERGNGSTTWTNRVMLDTFGNVNAAGFVGSGANLTGIVKTEADPVFTASAAYGISSNDISTWNGKQNPLVSGTNIKTVNGSSILGSGDLTISGTTISVYLDAATSVATGTWKNLVKVTLTEGIWVVSCGVKFPSGTKGIRRANLSTTSADSTIDIAVAPALSGVTQINFVKIVKITSSESGQKYYLNVYHSQGSSLSFVASSSQQGTYIYAVKIA